MILLDVLYIIIHLIFFQQIIVQCHVSSSTVWIGGANATKDLNKTSAIQASMYSVLEANNSDLEDSSASILHDN